MTEKENKGNKCGGGGEEGEQCHQQQRSLYSPRKDGFLCGNLSSILGMQGTHFLCRAKKKSLGLQVNPSFSFNKTFF